LGLRATPPWNILTNTSGQKFNGIGIREGRNQSDYFVIVENSESRLM